MSWAGFNVIEVMSSSKFTYKRIGYLASSQSFHADTDVSNNFLHIKNFHFACQRHVNKMIKGFCGHFYKYDRSFIHSALIFHAENVLKKLQVMVECHIIF